jgi:hypothetical protein
MIGSNHVERIHPIYAQTKPKMPDLSTATLYLSYALCHATATA